VHHCAELFHAGEDGQLLGFHVADAGGAQNGNHVGGDFAPVPLDLLLDIDFVDGEVVVDLQRVAGLGVEEAGFQVEGVGKAVRRKSKPSTPPSPSQAIKLPVRCVQQSQ